LEINFPDKNYYNIKLLLLLLLFIIYSNL